jgi:hypothetical protein
MNNDPLRPGTKANTWNRKNWPFYGLALGVLCLLGGPVRGQTCLQNTSCQPTFNLNGYDRGAKTEINTCTTNGSSSPCAWADVSEGMENFLACRLDNTGPIALCYYSGVPGSPLFTPSCTFSQAKNAAKWVASSTSPAKNHHRRKSCRGRFQTARQAELRTPCR